MSILLIHPKEVKVEQIYYLDVIEKDSRHNMPMGVLVKVLNIHPTDKSRAEVIPVSGDNAIIWIEVKNLYTKEKE